MEPSSSRKICGVKDSTYPWSGTCSAANKSIKRSSVFLVAHSMAVLVVFSSGLGARSRLLWVDPRLEAGPARVPGGHRVSASERPTVLPVNRQSPRKVSSSAL